MAASSAAETESQRYILLKTCEHTTPLTVALCVAVIEVMRELKAVQLAVLE